MNKLTKDQQLEINEIREELDGVSKSKTIGAGYKTRKLLDTLGIKSPPLKGAVEVVRGTWIVPKTEQNTDKEIADWKANKIKKYKLRDN